MFHKDREVKQMRVKKRAVLFCLLIIVAGTPMLFGECLANVLNPVDAIGQIILLVDGEEDGNSAVPIGISKVSYGDSSDADLWYRFNSGTWNLIPLPTGSFASAEISDGMGGDLLDFCLDTEGDGVGTDDLYSYNSSQADLFFSGIIDAGYSENPVVSDPYYRVLSLTWVGLPGYYLLDLIISQDVHDGFTPVPIPNTALLFGLAIVALVGGARLRLRRVGYPS